MSGRISATTTVREAVTRIPGAEAVFDRYGLTGCGGENGPVEPIGFFARVHHVDADALLRELNELAPTHDAETPAPSQRPAAAQAYRWFLLTALALALGGGISSGVASAMTGGGWGALRGEGWISLVQAHGHLQIFGFVGLFIVGMALHIVPRFKAQPPPRASLSYLTYGLITTGVLARALTQPHAQGWLRPVFVASGLVELAGALVFAALIFGILLRAGERREPFDAFIAVATAGLVGGFAINAYLAIDAAREGTRALNPAGDEALLLVMALGFVVPFVLGVSFRILPFFLGLRPPHARLRDASLAALAIALPLRTAAVWTPQFGTTGWAQPLERASAFGAIAAIAGIVLALRVFEAPAEDGERPPAYAGFAAAVRIAFVWLGAGLALDAYWQLRELDGGFTPLYAAGAIRHAYVLGFATLMMMAVSYRTVPVFSGRDPRWPGAIPLSFGLVVAATMLRVAPVAFQIQPSDLDFKLMVAGGVLLSAGFSIWAAELVTSMFAFSREGVMKDAQEQEQTAEGAVTPIEAPGTPVPASGPIRPEMTVAEALQLSPIVLQVLLDFGFGPLADPEMRARMAPTCTIERAAAFLSASPAVLVETLNQAVAATAAVQASGDGVAPVEVSLVETRVSEGAVLDALRTCYDPEIPVNIVDLGLIYRVAVHDAYAHVTMTLTTPACPLAGTLEQDVRTALLDVGDIETVDVDIVREPAWTPARMSRAARLAVGW